MKSRDLWPFGNAERPCRPWVRVSHEAAILKGIESLDQGWAPIADQR